MKPLKPLSALILIASALLLSAQSESPSIRNSQNQEAENQQSQTQKPPTPSVVSLSITAMPAEVIPTPEGNQPNGNSQSWNDWFWQNLTGILLVLVGIWAARIALGTLDQIAEQTRAGTIAAKAAETSATVARAALVASARPRMIVRRVSVSRFEGGEPIILQFIVANVGGSVAHILESNVTVSATTQIDLPAIPQYTDLGNNFLGATKFESGTSMPITTSNSGAIVPSDKTDIYNGSLRYRLLGYIQYRDDSGNVRRTAFCREKMPRQQRFIKINDPDYEYED